MTRRGHRRNIGSQAPARRDLVAETQVVQVYVVLHLIVHLCALHLIYRADVMFVRAVGSEAYSNGESVQQTDRSRLAGWIKSRDEGLWRMRGDTTLCMSLVVSRWNGEDQQACEDREPWLAGSYFHLCAPWG